MRFPVGVFHSAQSILEKFSRRLNWIAATMLVAMMLLLFVNIVIRIFYKPLLGIYEVVGLMTATLVSFALAYTQVLKGHIDIPIVASRLPNRVQTILAFVKYLVSAGVVSLIAWQSLLHGITLRYQRETSGVLEIPIFPFMFALAFGFAIFGLVIFLDLFGVFFKESKK